MTATTLKRRPRLNPLRVHLLLAGERLSRREVGRRLGVHYSTVCRWVAGETCPSWGTVERLAELLGTDPGRLLADGEGGADV